MFKRKGEIFPEEACSALQERRTQCFVFGVRLIENERGSLRNKAAVVRFTTCSFERHGKKLELMRKR